MGALLSELIRSREEEVAGGSEKKDERRESGDEVAENQPDAKRGARENEQKRSKAFRFAFQQMNFPF